MASHSETYKYSPLTSAHSIRVLRLKAGKGKPLQCDLVETSIDDGQTVQYEALSYAWGSREPPCYVSCGNERIRITLNCQNALEHLRERVIDRILWVDAICIDQSSMDERNAQVRIMGDIYDRAQRVIAWLGLPRDYTAAAFRWIRYLGHIYDRDNTSTVRTAHFLKLLNSIDDIRKRRQRISTREMLARILQHDYFLRIWTVQEVVFSSECILLSGNYSVPWSVFGRAAHKVAEHIDFRGSKKGRLPTSMGHTTHWSLWLQLQPPHKVTSALHDLTISRAHHDLNYTLHCARFQEASDDYDKIFSLYTIMDRMNVIITQPDYTKPLTQVYVETAVAAIKHTGSLGILCQTSGKRALPGLPSWVPDWSDDKPYANAAQLCQTVELQRAPHIAFRAKSRFLEVKVRFVDTVLTCEAAIDEDDISYPSWVTQEGWRKLYRRMHYLRIIRRWIDLVKQTTNDTQPARRSRDFFAIIDMINPPHKANTESYSDDQDEWYSIVSSSSTNTTERTRALDRQFLHKIKDIRHERQIDETLALMSDEERALIQTVRKLYAIHRYGGVTAYNRDLLATCQRNLMFPTKYGRVGIGFHAISPEDEVVLIEGLASPFVVRRDGDLYKLIAPVHVPEASSTASWEGSNDDIQIVTLK